MQKVCVSTCYNQYIFFSVACTAKLFAASTPNLKKDQKKVIKKSSCSVFALLTNLWSNCMHTTVAYDENVFKLTVAYFNFAKSEVALGPVVSFW